MSDTPEEPTESIPAATPVAPVREKPRRLNVVAAWVGIVAGAVVTVAVIFGTGFMVGAHSGTHHGGGYDRHHGNSEERRGGPPMWGPGGQGPDGPRGPGQLPQPPTGSTAPAPPTR